MNEPNSILKQALWDDKADGYSASRVGLLVGLSLNAIVVLWYITLVTLQTLQLGHFPQLLPDLSWLFGATAVGSATGGAVYGVNQFSRKFQQTTTIEESNTDEWDEEPIGYDNESE